METIYVLICVENKDIGKIIEEIKSLNDVKDVRPVTGAYDIIARIEAEYITELLTTVIKDIRKIDGIKSTETLVCIKL